MGELKDHHIRMMSPLSTGLIEELSILFTFLSFFFLRFIYYLFLATSGLSCGTQDLLLRHVGFSLVVACGFSLL